jgi:LuxR family maltose regulon positive regulatory protein
MKILIVDDHPLFLSGLRALFQTEKQLEVCGEASNGKEAIDQVEQLKPDIVIMDINMPGMNGIEATKEILSRAEKTKILALSIHSDKQFVNEMLDAGVVGYLLKDDAPEELVKAIERVYNGDMYLSPGVTRTALSKDESDGEFAIINVQKNKLQRPPVLQDYIIRSRIIDELEGNLVKPLSLISAGAGYGKSIVISQWLEQTRFLHAWISMDEEHNDLRIFLSYLIEAIENVIPGSFKETSLAIKGLELPTFKDLSYILFNDLCDIEEDLILVLDDYHKINDERIHNLLDEWLRFPPPKVHLSIITRHDPPLNLSSLHIAGRITEIRMKELSFTDEEINGLFKQILRIELSDNAVQMLQDKTEGWIIALRLASMVIKSSEDVDQVMQTFEGGRNTFSDYLITEVVSTIPEHIKDQLFDSSILNRFCAELLDEIVHERAEKRQQQIHGKEFILWVRKANMFVINLDLEGKWFRYHHLFQVLLQEQLKKEYSEKEIIDLHLKASHWFEKELFLEEAMYHALTASEYNRAVEIVKTHRLDLLNTGKWQLLNRLYRKLPKSITEVDPELLLVEAYLSFYLADHGKVGIIVEMMEPLMSGIEIGSILHAEYIFFVGYTTMYLKGDPATSLKHFKTALIDIPESASEPRALVELFYPMSSQMAGQYTDAIKWLVKTINRSENFAPIRKNRLLLSMFLTSTAQADLDSVENYYLNGLRIARESKMGDSLGTCLMMSGQLFMRRGEWSMAIRYFEEAVSLKYSVHTRAVIDSMTALIILFSTLGQHVRCQELINELGSFTQELGDYYERFLWSCKIRYHLLIKDMTVVRDLLPKYSPSFVHLVFFIDVPEITYARALILEGSKENLRLAEEELNKLEKMIFAQNNWIHLLEVYALQALLYEKLGDVGKAQEKLVKSVELAEPGGVVAYYIELGKPLENMIKSMPEEFQGRPLVVEINRILTATNLNQTDQISIKPALDVTKEKREKLNVLTQRELEVLKCISEGLRNQEIAEKLFNSEGTIKKHISHMFQKMNVKNRLSLVSKAKEEGILV